jgi:hypothetical protein
MFSLHKFLADSSTMIAWTWTGYPISGPVPNLHGSITLAAQAAGVLVSLAFWVYGVQSYGTTALKKGENTLPPSFSLLALLQSPVWYLFGVASSYVLYSFPDWVGYAGGLGLAVFLMSVIPVVIHQASLAASARGPAMVFMTTWFVVSVLDFIDVMTVAYAFVSVLRLPAALQAVWLTACRFPVASSSENARTCTYIPYQPPAPMLTISAQRPGDSTLAPGSGVPLDTDFRVRRSR